MKKIFKKNKGFTLVEMVVVIPVIILIIGVFIYAIISMTGDILTTRASGKLTYSIQDALSRIEQDVKISSSFLATNSISLTSPQGYNNDTTAFHNVSATNEDMLILNTYTTTKNPIAAAKSFVYLNNQPNACASSFVNENSILTMNVVYFVKDGTLWRRVLAGNNYTTSGCSIPWQKPSCAIDQVDAFCAAKDSKMVENLNEVDGFNVSYFTSNNSSSENSTAVNNAKTDAERQSALNLTDSMKVTINASSSTAGRDFARTGSITATVLKDTAPTIITQPDNLSVPSNQTNITFTATAFGAKQNVKWQVSSNNGSSWSDIAGATTNTLTVASITNLMDGYLYRAIFSNNNGISTSSPARLSTYDTEWQTMTLQNSWSTYNEIAGITSYNYAGYRKTSSGVVVLKGLLAKSTTAATPELVATLPVSYRPNSNLIFSVITNPNVVARVDINSNGTIYIYGNNSWIALDNIQFTPDTGRYARTNISTFSNGWANYNNGFATASYVSDDQKRVHIQSLLAIGTITDMTLMYAMPNSLLPTELYIPVAMYGGGYGYVGIGNGTTYTGVHSRGNPSYWLTTNYMYYPKSASVTWTNLALQNSWVDYTGGWTTAQYTKGSDGIVKVKGTIKNGVVANGTTLATLPVGYRPAKRMIFHGIDAGAYCRIDVDPNGSVIFYYAAAPANGWLSLDSITFYADQ